MGVVAQAAETKYGAGVSIATATPIKESVRVAREVCRQDHAR